MNRILDTIWYTLVTILYIMVICFLVKQLNKINESDLQHEKMSIIRQFAMFLAGYVAWTIYIIIEVFNTRDNALFVDSIIHAVAVVLWDVVPITYMLFVHHRTFRSMMHQLKLTKATGENVVHFSGNVAE